MVHLIVKLRPQMSSFVISIIGGYLRDEEAAEINKSLTLIPRLPSTPCGHFERSAKDEWAWIATAVPLVERVLLIVLDKLETLGWTRVSDFSTPIKEGGATTTWIFHNPKGTKAYIEEEKH